MIFAILIAFSGILCEALDYNGADVGKPVTINLDTVYDIKKGDNFEMEPSIYEMENVTVATNQEVILTCKAKGRPAPSIMFSRYGLSFKDRQWGIYKDAIQTQIFNEELGESIGTLNISHALLSYDGPYDCQAMNKLNSVQQTAYITIEFPPNFDYMKEPLPAYTWEMRPVNLTCLAKALPEASIDWYWNDKIITEFDDNIFNIDRKGSKSTLVVKPVDDSFYTSFKCVATNKHGHVERIMEIRHAHPPEAISEVIVRSWSTTTISFEITGSSTGMPAQFYKYRYKEEIEPDWINSDNMTEATSKVSTVHIQGLKPNTTYDFRFYAENELGTSQTKELSHRTLCDYNFILPKILNKYSEELAKDEIPFIESPYSDRFELIWEPIIEPCEQSIFYTIEYCVGSPYASTRLSIIEGSCKYTDRVTSNNYVIRNLTAETYYLIWVTALRIRRSEQVYMRTARDPNTGGDTRLKILPTYSLQTVRVGSSFNLTCKPKVENRELLTDLSWRDSFNNPINYKSSNSLMYIETVNGGDLSLVIPMLKYSMIGRYYCTAFYGSEMIETSVNIDMYQLVSETNEFNYIYGVAGSDGNIYCYFHTCESTVEHSIEWLFEGDVIEPSDRYVFNAYSAGEICGYVLSIKNLRESDEGLYICRLPTAEQQKIRFEVLIRPSILNSETEYSVEEGNEFFADCSGSGKPVPISKWLNQNGTDVLLNDRFSVNRMGRMQVTRIEESDSGDYTCLVDTLAGMSKKTIRLNVRPRNTI